jgi:hypothetical protein
LLLILFRNYLERRIRGVEDQKRQSGKSKKRERKGRFPFIKSHSNTHRHQEEQGEELLRLTMIGFSNAGNMHKVGYINNELFVHNLETNSSWLMIYDYFNPHT